jgi:hypothetical protein
MDKHKQLILNIEDGGVRFAQVTARDLSGLQFGSRGFSR